MTEITKKILERGVEEIIDKNHLETALKSGKKLRVKLGIDPTAPDIHLGHTVVLRKLRQFQDASHKAVLIIGDFTAQIGDPSGHAEARRPLSEKEVKTNLKKYLVQAGKVINIKKAEIRYNSEWHKKKGLKVMLGLAKAATIQQVLKREEFQKRMKAGSDISVLEILYPLFQGYDSVAVKADVELGGTDQKFNLLMGRRVQRYFNLPEQDIILLPLIEGTDGVRKMSKSYGNYIGLDEKPREMFGKIMSIPDSLIQKYFIALTDIDPPKNLRPRDQKLLLAETIVKMYHGKNAAGKAKENFVKVFSRKELPKNLPQLKLKTSAKGGSASGGKNYKLIELLIRAGVPSKSEARRLILQKAVEINGAVKTDPNEKLNLHGGEVLKIGKKKFFKIKVS